MMAKNVYTRTSFLFFILAPICWIEQFVELSRNEIGLFFLSPFEYRPNRPLSPRDARILSRFVCMNTRLQNNREPFSDEKRVAHVRRRLFLYLVTRLSASNRDKSRWKRGILTCRVDLGKVYDALM